MGIGDDTGSCTDELAVGVLLRVAAPRLTSDPSRVSSIQSFDGKHDHDTLVNLLRHVSGMRWDGGIVGRLGDPGDPWPVDFVVVDSSVIATAPEGFAGGRSRCEAQSLFVEWLENFAKQHLD